MVCLTTVIASDRYISFDKLDSFPIEVSNCELIQCVMYDLEGNELWSIEVEKESYSEFIKQMGKIHNTQLIEIR